MCYKYNYLYIIALKAGYFCVTLTKELDRETSEKRFILVSQFS